VLLAMIYKISKLWNDEKRQVQSLSY